MDNRGEHGDGDRRGRQQKGNACQDCGADGGRRRFEGGLDLGVLCDTCWKESLEDGYRKG